MSSSTDGLTSASMWCLSLSLVFAGQPDRSLSDELSARIAALELSLGRGEEEGLRLELAWARMEALQPEAAVDLVQPLLVQERAHPGARMLRARAWGWLGDPDRGLAELELIRHLQPGHVPSEAERRLMDALAQARAIQKTQADQGEAAERVRDCLSGLTSGQALTSWSGCLDPQLAGDLVRNLDEEQHVWAAEQFSRSLAEQLFSNAWMEPRGSQVVAHLDGRLEVWVWSEVHVDQGLFDTLIAGGLCASSCSDLPLGTAWRRLDASGRGELLRANAGRSLWQLQGFVLALGEEGRFRDVILLSGDPAVENLGSTLGDPTWRNTLLGLDVPGEGDVEAPVRQAPEDLQGSRELLYRALTALAVLLLLGLSVWIWRGGKPEPGA